MILSNCVLEEENSVDSSINDSVNEEEDKELQNIIQSNINNHKIDKIDKNEDKKEINKKPNKEKADNFNEDYIDMSVSNLSKIEIRNISVNSSCKSISRFEEQKDMIQLLDSELNVILIYI